LSFLLGMVFGLPYSILLHFIESRPAKKITADDPNHSP
jgi:hypothetical protein